MGWAFIISVGGILKSEVGRFFFGFCGMLYQSCIKVIREL